jgi:hypothetical protein
LEVLLPSEELQKFIRAALASLWELELLLAIARDRTRSWSADELNHELRANRSLVAGILTKFTDLGIAKEENGRFRCDPATPEIERGIGELQATYAVRPLAVVKAIASARDSKIQTIADAFRIKKD